MFNKIKFELYVFLTASLIYTVYSLYYIGVKLYNKDYNDGSNYTFIFNVGYFMFILTIHQASMQYVINKIKSNNLHMTMCYFGWLFLISCITIVMACTYSSYSKDTNYHKIVDMHTLVSTICYEQIVIFVVYIRISRKIDKELCSLEVIADGDPVTTYNQVEYV
jgi:hypothetical protein